MESDIEISLDDTDQGHDWRSHLEVLDDDVVTEKARLLIETICCDLEICMNTLD